MKEKNKKELIEVIKQQLQADRELPYREGAWEKFQAKYADKKPVKRLFPVYWGAAAAVLLLAFGLLYIYKGRPSEELLLQQQSASVVSPKEQPMVEKPVGNTSSDIPMDEELKDEIVLGVSVDNNEYIVNNEVKKVFSLQKVNNSKLLETTPFSMAYIPEISALKVTISPMRLSGDIDENPLLAEVDLGDQLTMAQQVNPSYAQTVETAGQLSPKRMKITDRMELGAFLSPGLMQESFDLGGGLVLGYRLSDKMTLRTGASFHQYEVNVLASDIKGKADQKQMDMPVGTEQLAAKGLPYQGMNVILPNLNAVTGKVQALDIPLELKYNMGKQFYTTAGVSYVAVLSQERYNHYREYSNPITYSSESENGQPSSQPNEMVERVTKSQESNVSTNGFGGFVNFSIGRQTSISRKLKLSVEPYVKIPVGQFKRTDMNYTNGGVRIMTHF